VIQIHQALFGYSNGHHMLSCSRQLSSYSLKILEPLSDLSGSEMQVGFEKYITGCPLVEDKCYALSTTWYAPEMKRPGCVWTHTLFIDFSDLDLLPLDNTIDELFTRPSKVNSLNIEDYSKPIFIKTVNNINVHNDLSDKQINELGQILKPLLETDKPFIIESIESKKYNHIIELLWLRLANSLFKTISFCTGSLSNRTINKKTLDVQIVPSSLFKNIARTNKDLQTISDKYTQEDIPKWLLIFIKEFIEKEGYRLKNFISIFSKQYFNRQYIKPFAELYLMTENKNTFDTLRFFDIIQKLFEGEERLYVNSKALSILLRNNKLENYAVEKPSIILQELSISDINDMIAEFDISIINNQMEKLWNTYPSELKEVFTFLICHEINSFGEQLIISLAALVNPERLSELTGPSFEGSNMLININGELALCKDLWYQPKNFQLETLDCLKKSGRKISLEINKKINTIIFNSSKESISMQLYDTFGDIALETFLYWAENIDDTTKLKRWSKLCEYNVSICIQRLPYIHNLKLVEIIINTLDPYTWEILSADKNIWLNIYNRFCSKYTDTTLFCNTFAQFILPIIIQSKEQYPRDVAYFAFSKVHAILSNNMMEYSQWERLSIFLPEVTWYNSWDKCKRLRKAAKKLHYSFDLKSF